MTLSERKRATVYDLVRAGQALHDTQYQLPAWVTIGEQSYLAVGDDNGNGAKKLAVLTEQARLVTTRIPSMSPLRRSA